MAKKKEKKKVQIVRANTRESGDWILQDIVEMCQKHIELTREVYKLVIEKGVVNRNSLKSRDQKLALRLAKLGYLQCNTYKKDATDRIFKPAPIKPAADVLNLLHEP
jgi:hypothetical protein